MMNPQNRNQQLPFIRPQMFGGRPQRTDSALSGKVTEIIVHDDDMGNLSMLLPLLARLSQDDRWFVWVAPPVILPKRLLQEAGIDLNKVILLQPDAQHSVYDLARRALKVGTCHAVISWPGALSDEELCGLEEAAHFGRSHGIVVRRRLS